MRSAFWKMTGILAIAALFGAACTPEENNPSGTDEPGGGKDKTVHVTGIQLDRTSATIKEGESLTLVVTVTPSDANNRAVTWTSSNTSVATVSSSGVVTGKSRGMATITVTANDGSGVSATCEVEVKQYVTSISLDKTSLSLVIGEEQTLTVTVNPNNATNSSLSWTSNDTSIATVDAEGKVTAKEKGKTTIKATANDGSGVSASCEVVVSPPCPVGAVDMGINTTEGYKLYWATCNIGASKPDDYGDYYAWGETETKSNYSWPTYKFGTSSSGPFSKYNTNSSYGPIDNKTILEPEDDVAHVRLGGKWRMPTDAEWTELRTKCSWTWTTQNGVKGRLVTATNGNSIFLPAAGFRDGTNLSGAGSLGFYWSSSLTTGYPDYAWLVLFDSVNVYRYGSHRYYGQSVRPVSE